MKKLNKTKTLTLRLCAFLAVFSLLFCEKAFSIYSEQFKMFIANPPKSARVIITLASQSQLASTNDIIKRGSKYEFDWAGEDIQILELGIGSIQPVTNNQVARGSYQGKTWEYSKSNLTYLVDEAPNNEIGSRFILQTFLHFGIQDLSAKTMQWAGNHFTAKLSDGTPISGDLKMDATEQSVAGISYEIESVPFSYEIICKIDENTNFLAYPSSFDVYGIHSGHRDHFFHFEVIEFDGNPTFDPESMNPEKIFSNAREIIASKPGVISPRPPTSNLKTEPASISRYARVWILIIMLAVTGCFAFLILKSMYKKTPK